MLRLIELSMFKSSGLKKAEFLRKKQIFETMGKNWYYYSIIIPSIPKNLKMGNNVTICTGVKFFDHDIIHRIWNEDDNSSNNIKYYSGKIVIDNNVCICGNSIILYNVYIHQNSIIAAGSVLTKDVPEYAIVAGNPARIIGDTRELYKKRKY